MVDLSIERDIACVGCGYNLRGLPVSGHCPECGESVENSLLLPDLASHGKRWLSYIRVGLRIQIVTLLFGIFYHCLWFVYYFRLRALLFIYRPVMRGPTHFILMLSWHFLDLTAVWLVTGKALIGLPSTEPFDEEKDYAGELIRRKYLRFFACFSFIGGFLATGVSPAVLNAPSLFSWTKGGIDLITVYLFYNWIEKDLARRARSNGVIRQAKLLKFIKSVSSVVLPLMIEFAYGFGWINRSCAILLFSPWQMLYIAMNIWAIAVLWMLLQAFHGPMQNAAEA